MKTISILGSTGSIGTQTLDVIRHDRERYRVVALAAGGNVDLLVRQALEFRPSIVSLATREAAERAASMLPADIRVLHGEEGLIEAAAGAGAELVVTALVGSRGIRSTIAAIEAGAAIGLANKETLVAAGHLVTKLAESRCVPILPVDSEHSAIFQCLNGERRADVKKITLTASGGAFRDRTRAELKDVTVEQALIHPNWAMGAKITIDSATMANKGLEVIEAHWLYSLPYEQIDVLLHPESIIHSMVEFADNSVIAQLGVPDMRIPIQSGVLRPRPPSIWRRSDGCISGRWILSVIHASGWLTRRGAPAVRRRSSSTPRTKRRWKSFCAARSRFCKSRIRSRRCSTASCRNRSIHTRQSRNWTRGCGGR